MRTPSVVTALTVLLITTPVSAEPQFYDLPNNVVRLEYDASRSTINGSVALGQFAGGFTKVHLRSPELGAIELELEDDPEGFYIRVPGPGTYGLAIQSCTDFFLATDNCSRWHDITYIVPGEAAVAAPPVERRTDTFDTAKGVGRLPGMKGGGNTMFDTTAPAAETPAPPPPAEVQRGAIINGDVDVYDQPGGNGNVITYVASGTPVQSSRSECIDGWCPISGPNVPNGFGWVWGEFVSY